jgi:hypothetical protein
MWTWSWQILDLQHVSREPEEDHEISARIADMWVEFWTRSVQNMKEWWQFHPDLRYRLAKTTTNFNEDSRHPGQDSNRRPSGCKSVLLWTSLLCLFVIITKCHNPSESYSILWLQGWNLGAVFFRQYNHVTSTASYLLPYIIFILIHMRMEHLEEPMISELIPLQTRRPGGKNGTYACWIARPCLGQPNLSQNYWRFWLCPSSGILKN